MSLAPLWSTPRSSWVVYEDDDLVVIDKPAGLCSMPEAGRDDDALCRTRLVLWGDPSASDAPLSALARLDRLASGLVVFGRTPEANRSLAAQLERGVRRRYRVGIEASGAELPTPGAAAGAPSAERGSRRDRRRQRDGPQRAAGNRRGPSELRRAAGGRHAHAGPRRLLELETTARKQDVRAQLARTGPPIAGDIRNGGSFAPRLMLHLESMDIEHPRTGRRVRFACPTPPAMLRWQAASGSALDDDEGLGHALRAAASLRWRLGLDPTTTTFRLVNGAGDGLDGVTVDRYGDFLVVFLVGPAVSRRERILDALERLGPRGIYLKLPPRDPRQSAGRLAELAPPRAVRGEDAPQAMWVSERGLDFEVRLGDGLGTGLFVDQRANRQLIRSSADGRRLANLFAYTGSFTVAAIAGGARSTVTVDASAAVLAWASHNVSRALRGPTPDSASSGAPLPPPAESGPHADLGPNHLLRRADALQWLRQGARREHPFDIVVLDPPSFSTTRSSRFSAGEDYERLAAAALGRVAPGGRLLASTNHRGIRRAALAATLERAATKACAGPFTITALPDPLDCPTLPGEPSHLKAMLVERSG